MSDIEKQYLIELLVKLKLAKNTLEYSYNICQGIGEKDLYSEEEADRFESLTSKFARLSDLILKKVCKYLFDSVDKIEVYTNFLVKILNICQ